MHAVDHLTSHAKLKSRDWVQGSNVHAERKFQQVKINICREMSPRSVQNIIKICLDIDNRLPKCEMKRFNDFPTRTVIVNGMESLVYVSFSVDWLVSNTESGCRREG